MRGPRTVDVLLHEEIPAPVTCVALHPVVLLPFDVRSSMKRISGARSFTNWSTFGAGLGDAASTREFRSRAIVPSVGSVAWRAGALPGSRTSPPMTPSYAPGRPRIRRRLVRPGAIDEQRIGAVRCWGWRIGATFPLESRDARWQSAARACRFPCCCGRHCGSRAGPGGDGSLTAVAQFVQARDGEARTPRSGRT